MNLILEQQFREIVEAELADKGWNRSDLARAMGVATSYVSIYLNGRSSAGPDVMEKFFLALGKRPRLTVEPVQDFIAVG